MRTSVRRVLPKLVVPRVGVRQAVLRSAALRTAMGLALAIGSVGCATAPAAGESAALEGSVGVLDVERVADEATDRTELTAAFARYRGTDAAAVLALLGSRSPAEVEACTFVGADDPVAAATVGPFTEGGAFGEGPFGEVELLDVGTIRVRVADTEASLSPRAFPDLASVLAGVFYAGDASLAIARPDVDEYAFEADGSAELPAFAAVVLAPGAPAELRIQSAGIPRIDEGPIVASRESSLELAWTASGGARDVVEIEVRSGGDVLSCTSHDDGAFRIEAESLATLAPDAAASIVVRRVRMTSVEVAGLDEAFARVAVARELAIDLR